MTRVVMLVANNVYTDTRVKKEALAVSRMGLEVTILGLSDNGQQSVSMLGPVRIVRVPIDYVLRERRRHRREQRRKYRPPFPGLSRRLRQGGSTATARCGEVTLRPREGRAQVGGGSWITPVACAISSLDNARTQSRLPHPRRGWPSGRPRVSAKPGGYLTGGFSPFHGSSVAPRATGGARLRARVRACD